MQRHTVLLSRTIAATAQALWDAWTKPAQLNKWFTTGAKVNLRVGGRYLNDDKDCGEYLTVESPTRLVFSWEQPMHQLGSRVALVITPLAEGRSRLTLRHSRLATASEAEGLYEGWSWALDSLKSFAETGTGIREAEWTIRHQRRG